MIEENIAGLRRVGKGGRPPDSNHRPLAGQPL